MKLYKNIIKFRRYLNVFISNRKDVVKTVTLAGILIFAAFDVNGIVFHYGDVGLAILLLLYILLQRLYKFTSKTTFLINMLLLIIMFACYISIGTVSITERLAVWFVLVFAFGLIQQWNEI